MNGVLPRAMVPRLAPPPRKLKRPSPTPQGQNVYVFTSRRIRFVPIRLYVVGKAESRRAVEGEKD